VCAGSRKGSVVTRKRTVVGVTPAESAGGSGGGGTVPTGGAHETERAGERMGSRVDERARVTKRDGSRARRKLVLTSRPHWVERGRESMRGMVLTVRLSGRGGHARVGARIGFWPS
jgi:hypothetical protein